MTSGRECQFPDAIPGSPVSNVPSDLGELFEEERESESVGAYTGAVMLCRKILMNISAREGAKTD